MTLVLSVAGFLCAQAQMFAYTKDGRRVALYSDHTWVYVDDDPWAGDEWRGPSDGRDRRGRTPHIYGPRTRGRVSGKNAEIILGGTVRFIVKDGRLATWDVLVMPKNESNSYRNSDVEYEPFGDKIVKIGPYNIEYEPFGDRVTKVGPYEVEYEPFSDRVIRLGQHEIRYAPFSNLIERIGRTEIKYAPFSEWVKDIQGETPDVNIYLF